MKTAVKRKLIDIKPAVFDSLMVQAKGEGLSLKKYIEALLERESQKSGHGIPHSVKAHFKICPEWNCPKVSTPEDFLS